MCKAVKLDVKGMNGWEDGGLGKEGGIITFFI
jgi:hypothetical protein